MVNEPLSFASNSTTSTGTTGSEFAPFQDAGRPIYTNDPYRTEPAEIYANPGAPPPDFGGGHVRNK